MVTPDDNIKKIIIQRKDLPDITSDLKYFFRYRIISEDKTLTSEWSQKHTLTARPITYNLPYKISSDGQNISISWNVPADFPFTEFDVFASWSSNSGSTWTSPAYDATVSSTSHIIKIPTTPISYIASKGDATKLVKVRVQVKTVSTKVSTDQLRILETAQFYTYPSTNSLDGGPIA